MTRWPAVLVAFSIFAVSVSCAPAHGTARAPVSTRPAYTAAELANVVQISNVALSPDGKLLAFVSDKSGAYELWTAPLEAGALGTPTQRTHANEHVTALAWAPDSTILYFDMDRGGDERDDLWQWRRTGPDADAQRVTETPYSEDSPHVSPDGTSILLAADPEAAFKFDIGILDLSSKKLRMLTHEKINVYGARWSRDGKTIVAVRTPDDQKGDLLVIDVASGATRVVHPPVEGGILVPVAAAPDGRFYATTTNKAGFAELVTVDLATLAVSAPAGDAWDVEAVRVGAGGRVIRVRNVHGESEVSVSTPGPFRVLASEGIVGGITIDRDASTIVAVRTASNRPAEIVSLDPVRASVKLLLPASVGSVDLALLAKAERRTVKSFDGTPIDAYVWKPPVARLGFPAPCVIYVHGGPDSQSRGDFAAQVQALAEAGFVVASVNYRGSTGYGRVFQDMNRKDWGGGDLKDLVAVVEDLASKKEIDRARTGIIGGSFGGYMVLRALTAAPDVFHAGVDLYGVADLEEDYRLTVNRDASWYQTEMGTPETDAALFRDRSPIHALDRIRAPLLVLQGANDNDVPRAESDAVVEALRARKQAVEYTVYPNEGHGFTHRENRVDAQTRAVDFFSRVLR